MNKVIFTVTAMALSLMAFIWTHPVKSEDRHSSYHKSKNKKSTELSKEARLRECISRCVPATCIQNKNLAQECTKLCRGHHTSVAEWLYKKCSMTLGHGQTEIQDYSLTSGAESMTQWKQQKDWKKEPSSRWNPNEESAQWQKRDQWKGSPQSPNESVAQAQKWQGSPEERLWAQSQKESIWRGSSKATLGERTLAEAISPENIYGFGETELQNYGLDKNGNTLSQSWVKPSDNEGYGRDEVLQQWF